MRARLHAAWSRLVALWHRRWERPEPRHTARPAEPAEPASEPEGPSPADLTQMDFPPQRARPYVDPDDGPKHRKPR